MSRPEKTLVLLRHGESVWNRENRFTGWTDVPLTTTGLEQAREAGVQLRRAGFAPVAAHASMLKRAIHTLREVLDRLDRPWLQTRYAFELNERHYGALQGQSKAETERRYGADQTTAWRRGFVDTPPVVASEDPRNPLFDPRYARVPEGCLPRGESLRDTLRRVVPYWERAITRDLEHGPVLVVAHGNSLRALVMHLECLSPEEIRGRNIPTGIPLLYRLDSAFGVLDRRHLAESEELAGGLARAAARP